MIHFVKTDVIARSRWRRGNLVWRLPRSLRLPRNDGIHTGLLRSYIELIYPAVFHFLMPNIVSHRFLIPAYHWNIIPSCPKVLSRKVPLSTKICPRYRYRTFTLDVTHHLGNWIFGGIEIRMWTWSAIKCPSSIVHSFRKAISFNSEPRYGRSSLKIVFLRYFGIQTIWYLQSYFVWFKLCGEFIVYFQNGL